MTKRRCPSCRYWFAAPVGTGKRAYCPDCLGDGIGFNQPRAGSAEVNSRGRVDVKIGRISKSVWGMKEGVFALRHYALADLVDELDSAEAEQGLMCWLTDSPAPGPHVTFGGRWIPFSLDSANAVNGSGFTWTPTVTKNGGPPTSVHTEVDVKTFTKTAADESWDIIIYSADGEAITGDQKITFKIKHISNNPLMMVGFMDSTGAPTGPFDNDVTHGLYQQNALLFRLLDSAVPFDTYHSGFVVGDEVEIRMVGGTVTSTVNGGAPLTIKTGAANVAYRVAVSFNHVGAAIENLRHVAL